MRGFPGLIKFSFSLSFLFWQTKHFSQFTSTEDRFFGEIIANSTPDITKLYNKSKVIPCHYKNAQFKQQQSGVWNDNVFFVYATPHFAFDWQQNAMQCLQNKNSREFQEEWSGAFLIREFSTKTIFDVKNLLVFFQL